MNKPMIMILSAAILLTALSGCAAIKPAINQSTIPPMLSEPAQPSPSADAQVPATEPPADAQVQVTELPAATQASATEPPAAAPASENALTEFKSDFGYTISYQESSFDYRRTEGYDEYVLKSDALDKPFVFICISHVGAEFVDQMKAAALGENPEACTVGQAQMQAQCSETKEAWDGGELIRKTYVCMLHNGDALLIETQRYTEQTDDPYAAWLLEMVNSITV